METVVKESGYRRRMRFWLKLAACMLIYDIVLTVVVKLNERNILSNKGAVTFLAIFTLTCLIAALAIAFMPRKNS